MELFFIKYQKGVSTLEMLIAMTIIVVAISATLPLTSGNQSTLVSSQTNQKAIYKAQLLLENARATAQSNFSSLISSAPQSDGFYTSSLTINPSADGFSKTATSLVYWGTNHIQFSTVLSDWQSATVNCKQTLPNPNGWKNPQSYLWDMGQLGVNGGNGNGFSISNLTTYKQKLYVTMSSTPSTYKNTLLIFNIPSDPTQPPIYDGGVDNAPSINSAGLNAIAVYGNYAFVANGYTGSAQGCTQGANCAQLQVINISNSSNPSVVTNLKIPAVTSDGNLAAANVIYYFNGYIYLGLAKAGKSGFEFNIIDVGGGGGPASPTNPIWKGGYSIGNGINAITISGNDAYVATPNTESLTIIDITSPTNPLRAGGFTPPVGSSNGESIFISGNTAYFGRAFGSNEFYILNASTLSNISALGSQDIGSGSSTSVYGISVKSNLAFLTTKGQFQVWDISNQADMQPWSSDGTTNTFLSLSALGGTGTSATCTGDNFYLAIASSKTNNKDIISIITPGI